MSQILIDKRVLLYSLRKEHKYLYQIDISSLCIDDNAPNYAVIRPMTRREFNLISSDPESIEDSILSSCLLYPVIDKYNESYLAGIDSVIVSAVNHVSGFLKEQSLLEGVIAYREYAKSLEATIVMFICKAFPVYSVDDIDNMCFEEQMRLAALAEQIIGQPIPYEEFLNPKPKKEKDSKTKKEQRLEEFRAKQRVADKPPAPPPPQQKQSFVNERLIKKENFAKEMDALQEFLGQPNE